PARGPNVEQARRCAWGQRPSFQIALPTRRCRQTPGVLMRKVTENAIAAAATAATAHNRGSAAWIGVRAEERAGSARAARVADPVSRLERCGRALGVFDTRPVIPRDGRSLTVLARRSYIPRPASCGSGGTGRRTRFRF